MRTATREDMQQIEQRAMAGGLSAERLMENAGTAAAHAIRIAVGAPRETVVLCGKGNNGGDGFVIARKLAENGYPVTVILLEGEPVADPAKEAFSRCGDIPVIRLEDEPYRAAAAVTAAPVVVDAVYGIGFHGALPKEVAQIFALTHSEKKHAFAVDIPSGLVCDSGKRDPDTFCADMTLTFTAEKPGFTLPENAGVCGKIQVLDIGIAQADIDAVLAADTLSWQHVKRCFQARRSDTHKGSYGHLLAVCGSYGMAGATILAAKAALRSGLGLLTVALPRSIYPIAAAAVPEAVFLPLPETGEGTLSETALPLLRRALKEKSALLIGPGLGRGEAVELLVGALLAEADCPMVLDADGLNALALHIDMLETVHAPCVLTPHPGEMARLIGKSTLDIQENRAGSAAAFAERYGVTLVLKGHHTLIAAPHTLHKNPTGNPGMATGGSGDVLAGMIASLLAQGLSPADAATAGVYLHGMAGDRAAAQHSQHSMLPSDMITQLGGLFLTLEQD